MHPLCFRVTDAPDRAAFDRHWTELPPAPFVVDRAVVRSEDVSRSGRRCVPAETRRRRERDVRARAYLDRHRDKRLVLAYQWRQHIGHTLDAEDLSTADVGRAFGLADRTVSAHRSALAEHVYGETGHQHAIRDLVIRGGLLTWADVAEADREVTRPR